MKELTITNVVSLTSEEANGMNGCAQVTALCCKAMNEISKACAMLNGEVYSSTFDFYAPGTHGCDDPLRQRADMRYAATLKIGGAK